MLAPNIINKSIAFITEFINYTHGQRITTVGIHTQIKQNEIVPQTPIHYQNSNQNSCPLVWFAGLRIPCLAGRPRPITK